jgi:hypothetical protein
MQMTNSNNQMKDKSWQTKQLERRFRSLKMRWRRSTANAPVDVNNSLYIDMLAARKAAKISYARDKRKKQQGDWDTISALASGQRFAAMWRKLTAKHVNHALDKPTLDMIEDGLRQVSQTGFPHNELESKIWEAELRAFTAPPHDVPDEVSSSQTSSGNYVMEKLWGRMDGLKNGYACSEVFAMNHASILTTYCD